MWVSLVVVGLAIPIVVGSIDDEVGGIDVVALDCCFEQFGVVDGAVFQEVQLFILHPMVLTFMLTPQMRSSSASTFRSYFNCP